LVRGVGLVIAGGGPGPAREVRGGSQTIG